MFNQWKNDGCDSGEQIIVGICKRKQGKARQGVKHRRLEVNVMPHQVKQVIDAVTMLLESTALDGGVVSGGEDVDARVKEELWEQNAEMRGLVEENKRA